MIRIKNVNVLKSGNLLFQNFSWDIHPDENWVITGPNGSGKTILLEALAGILHFPKGEIQYDFIDGGTWDTRYAEKRKNITYIPAHALESFAKGQGMYYQQRYYGIGDEEISTVRSILGDNAERLNELKIPTSLSIDHLLDLDVTRLSNGQLKKVLLLRSFLRGIPKLLLLDYPFEGLDHHSRADLCLFIDFVCKQHSTQVILVDHHHYLPTIINKKLTLRQFKIENSESFYPAVENGLSSPKIKTTISQPEGVQDMIVIKNLHLKYGAFELFKNFNWTVKKGERWALVGRNGAGKTTLFSMIFADHPQAYAQEIYLFGKRRGTGESIWDIKRRINYMGPEQISYLNTKNVLFTAREYINSVNNKVNSDTLENLIHYFNAHQLIDKQVRLLSSGEMQLLLTLNCFLSDKELWLLDEPFQFLDGEHKERVTNYLLTHLTAETTLILITHYEYDLRQWTDKKMSL